MSDQEKPRPRANPTDHVDYFVFDPEDAEIFEHARERVTTVPPQPVIPRRPSREVPE